MTPLKAGALKKGGHIQIKGHPCKIVNMSTSKTGKHGHAKLNITALDVLTGRKYEDMCPSTHNVNVPIVTKNEYQVIGIEDGMCQLMDESGNQIDDVKIPDEQIGQDISDTFEAGDKDVLVTVLTAPVGENPDTANWERIIIGTKTVT